MAIVTHRINRSIEVPVVDHNGIPLGETRTFVNPPISYYFPDHVFVVIDWLAVGNTRPTVELINTPVTVDGVVYYGNLLGGSMVKSGMTLGVQKDYLDKMIEKISDVVRGKRSWFCDFLYGANVYDDLKVTIVQEGKTYGKGLPAVPDGWGFCALYMSLKPESAWCSEFRT